MPMQLKGVGVYFSTFRAKELTSTFVTLRLQEMCACALGTISTFDRIAVEKDVLSSRVHVSACTSLFIVGNMVSNVGRRRSSSGGTEPGEGVGSVRQLDNFALVVYTIMEEQDDVTLERQERTRMDDRETRRKERQERHKEQRQIGFSSIRVETLMGEKKPTRWDARHLEQCARPLSSTDPASEGLERLILIRVPIHHCLIGRGCIQDYTKSHQSLSIRMRKD
eukprot:6484180-Amphidinium_carterae.1